jgi:3-deoxy-7-phosphoheptulonate synthase
MGIIDTNIKKYSAIISPADLKDELPISKSISDFVQKTRIMIQDIISGKDKRKLIICGPCSIHDSGSAIEYAGRLAGLSERVEKKFLIIMRTYFEKPRTSVGWKGMLNDPHLDGSYDINEGLKITRRLLIDINRLKIGCATEYLEPFTPQFIDDLVSYAAIGARTTESPTHRQLASGLSVPVGFKNSMSGDIKPAVNAVHAANHEQAFLGMDNKGNVCNVFTKGNKYAHIILRGGKTPNFDEKSVSLAAKMLDGKGLCGSIIIDCSHGNSNKDYRQQPVVFGEIMSQVEKGNDNIVGMMIESHLNEGSQEVPNHLKGFDRSKLKYGVSITDSCLGWDETEKIILEGYAKCREQ